MSRRPPRSSGAAARPARLSAATAALALLASVSLSSRPALAQQRGYAADRILLGTNPDDGLAIWRPVMSDQTRFFGDVTAEYLRRPLRLSGIEPDPPPRTLASLPSGIITNQGTLFASVGAEIIGRFGLAATLPVTLINTSNDPTGGRLGTTGIDTGASAGDLRFDARWLAYYNDARTFRVGFDVSYFAATGSDVNFTGDGVGHTVLMAMLEERAGALSITENVGVDLRDRHVVGSLAFQNELNFALGAFLPLRDNKIRLGLQVHGSTGVSSPADINGNSDSTFLTKRNTPLEWLGEARFALTPNRQLWLNAGAGTLLLTGYSAPDVRVLAQLGYYFNLFDATPKAPERKFITAEERVDEHEADRDHDGIPDAIDACPDVPGVPSNDPTKNGCPPVADRDKDGIPDSEDACPDVPGVATNDPKTNGCPDNDYDKDGIPNVTDACPHEPGEPSKDPKKNGCPQFIKRVEGSNEIQVLKKIEFDTGKATIRPESFPILEEVVKLMKVNNNIRKLSVEGHTDDRGKHQMNMDLSRARAASVMGYLTEHGVEASRLGSEGFGPDKPLVPNTNDANRFKNRRVEFHITDSQ